MATSKPLERLPGETPKAFEARRIYLEMGPSRSLVKVWQIRGGSRATIEGWSRKWSWVASADAYDRYNAEIVAKAAAEARVVEARAHAEKWAKRDDEHLEAMYMTFIYAFNELAEIKITGRKASRREKSMILQEIARLWAPSREARLEAGEKLAATGARSSSDVGQAARMSEGRQLAVLKALIDYHEPDDDPA